MLWRPGQRSQFADSRQRHTIVAALGLKGDDRILRPSLMPLQKPCVTHRSGRCGESELESNLMLMKARGACAAMCILSRMARCVSDGPRHFWQRALTRALAKQSLLAETVRFDATKTLRNLAHIDLC